MTQHRDGRPRTSAVVSPELALVDPELAAAERELLPAIPASEPPRTPAPRAINVAAGTAPHARPVPAPTRERGTPHRLHSRRVLAGIGTATVLVLLLLDVRVEVGRNPASAERRPSASPKGPAVVARAPSPSPVAPRPAESQPPRRFAWAPVAGAEAYDVELFRGSERVLLTRTTRPELDVPSSWSYEGRRFALVGGTYRWYVWAVVSGMRAATAIVQSRLVVSSP